MNKKLLLLISSCLLLLVALLFFYNRQQWQETLQAYIENSDILTLEAHYSPEQIMDQQRGALIGALPRTYQNAQLEYEPYLLLEVKYPMGQQGQTKEGKLLWSMVDGELLLDTETWQTSHGYGDAIRAGASRSDYRLLHALAKKGGSATNEQLMQMLQIDEEQLESWVAAAKKKELIIQKGNNSWQLHFQQPRLAFNPETKIDQQLVTRPYSYSQLLSAQFTQKQIETAVKAIFGSELALRGAQKVYLPVLRIQVANPDDSVLTSYWNAVNGQRILHHL